MPQLFANFHLISQLNFSLDFHWYGLIVGSALALFLWQWSWWMNQAKSTPKQRRQNHFVLTDRQLNWAWLLLIIGIFVGARFYHLWTDWSLYADKSWWSWWQVWHGGLGVLGAIAGGSAGLYIWHRWQKPGVSWLASLDAAALSLPLAQALGRWGNFVNQELFGVPTSAWWGIYIPPAQRPVEFMSATHFHPLFLYEAVALILLAVALYGFYRYFNNLFPLGSGYYTSWYLISYGSIRFSLEMLRINSAIGWGGLTIAQWICLIMVAVGLWLLPRGWRLAYND